MERYRSLSSWIRTAYGRKLYKIPLDIGLGCPNRDGTLGYGGCAFCSAKGSGDFSASSKISAAEQISRGIEDVKSRLDQHYSTDSDYGYIAYYQAYTNTYAEVPRLRELYAPALNDPRIAVISIATRSDCINDGVIQLLREYAEVKPVWVELGFQSMHDETLARMNVMETCTQFDLAVSLLKAAGIPVIAHAILGLPGESCDMILSSVQHLARMHVDGVKLQLLHVLRGTELEKMYRRGTFPVLTEPEYIDLVVRSLEILPPDCVIHRLTGDGPRDLLIAPLWSLNKRRVLNGIGHELKIRDTWQGRSYHG